MSNANNKNSNTDNNKPNRENEKRDDAPNTKGEPAKKIAHQTDGNQ